MLYRQSFKGCLADTIGSAGLDEPMLQGYLGRLRPRFEALSDAARESAFPHFRVLSEKADIVEARASYEKLAEGADTIVMFGTGGSSLGGQAIAQLGGWTIPGDNGPDDKRRPRLRFYDNLDARSFMSGLRILDIPKTRFIVISKSGATGETLAQTLTAFRYIEDEGHSDLLPGLFLGITEPARPGVANGLRTLFEARNIPVLPHDAGIGGRYSAFTTVGLIPAFARGLDPFAFRAGGREVVEALAKTREPADHPAAIGAALSVALAKEKGVTKTVMMPYSDRLARFAAWFVQLWAESLGKRGEGTTPVAALGPVDQHSQLQLWMDGPPHLLTIVRIVGKQAEHEGLAIPPALAAEAGAPYLSGKSIGDLVRAQQQGVVDALIEAKRPVRAIDIDRLDISTLGALMMHFMIETILAADLLGVDPFDQPAVELGKKLTRQYLVE